MGWGLLAGGRAGDEGLRGSGRGRGQQPEGQCGKGRGDLPG